MQIINKLTPLNFQKIVFKWFDAHGRKTLPWQENKTPYRVWVSEIMLQQTQVSTVIPYFQRFMSRFPTIEMLAKAKEDEVLHLWTGLGYYSRARNLHRSAQLIGKKNFPDNLIDLQTLPGIGRSTAGAIMAIAFEKKAAILDGNVKRVLARLHGVMEWPGEKKTIERLWDIAEKYMPSKRIADYTQAMMDIGATLCVRGKPRCTECPLQKYCIAYQENLTHALPKKKPARTLPIRNATFLILQKKDFILLEKRPPTGIWGGLWSLPEIVGLSPIEEVLATCKQRFRYTAKSVNFGERFRHTFSHFHLDILPVFISLNESRGKIMEADQQIWYNLQEPNAIGLPAPVKNLLERIIHDPYNRLHQTTKKS